MELRKLTWLLLTLCSLKASGADLQHPEFIALLSQPPASQSVPGGVPNLRFWWVASDMTTNVPATNWIDRIQSQSITNTAANGPTNSASGVGFSGSTFLQFRNAFPLTIDNTGSVYIVLTPVTPAGAFCPIIGITDSSGYGIITTSGGDLKIFATAGSGTISSFASAVATDLAMVITNVSGNNFFYTNAIALPSILSGDFPGDLTYVGKAGFGGLFKGTIKEILVYSNALTSVQVSNIHYYATNLYGYSP